MEEYISYHKIIQLFENYQISQKGIGLNSFGHGNIVDFGMTNSGVTPTYPFMFVTPQQISYNENTTNWTIQVIFADRIHDDMSNEIDVISDMSIQAKRFISYIRRGFDQDPPLYDFMDCTLPVGSNPFMERFNDYVGGVSLNLEITVFEDINACDYYDFTISPSPTPTPFVCNECEPGTEHCDSYLPCYDGTYGDPCLMNACLQGFCSTVVMPSCPSLGCARYVPKSRSHHGRLKPKLLFVSKGKVEW